MMRINFSLVSCALVIALGTCIAVPNQASAVLVTIIDTTAGSATNDGTIGSGEYVGSSSGINGGFGNVIGSASKLHVDSSVGGALNFGLLGGGGSLNNYAVIYIDSISGGLNNTTTIEDTGDLGRAAISGDGKTSGQSEITFATGFNADYAISISSGSSDLFQIGSGGALTHVISTNITPSGDASAGAWELDLTLSQIGLSPGDSFDYIATYLNADNAFRSDEFNGIPEFLGGNPGSVDISLGNFNTFVSVSSAVPEPSAFLFGGLVCSMLGANYVRKHRSKRHAGVRA